MDLFKKCNSYKATSYDFYDTHICKGNAKSRDRDKRMLHKLSRSRIKRLTLKEANESNE